MSRKIIAILFFAFFIGLNIFVRLGISGSSDSWIDCCSFGCTYVTNDEVIFDGNTYCCDGSDWISGPCSSTSTTTSTTSISTTTTTTSTTTTTTTTPPPDDGGMMLLLAIAGVGGALIVVVVLFLRSKK